MEPLSLQNIRLPSGSNYKYRYAMPRPRKPLQLQGGAACTNVASCLADDITLAEMAAVSTPVIYMEGIVYKRSRGRRHPSRVKKTQKRFCRLTKDSFDYFEPPKKGSNLDTVNTDLSGLKSLGCI